jgi:electron transport complex protein RnfG
MRRDTFKLAFILFVAASVSAATLSIVYTITKPKIDEYRTHTLQSNLKEVLEGATEFEEIITDTLWRGVGSTGDLFGIAFKVFPKGYGGPIETLVGLKADTSIAGIIVASPAEGMKETPGLGIKVREDWFRSQFRGKKTEELLLKKDGGTFDAVTAATISSRAVVNGVKEGVERYERYLTEGE